MNIRCPHCQTVFRVDPQRIPASGARARCARCSGVFRIESPHDATAERQAAATAPRADPEPAAPPETAPAAPADPAAQTGTPIAAPQAAPPAQPAPPAEAPRPAAATPSRAAEPPPPPPPPQSRAPEPAVDRMAEPPPATDATAAPRPDRTPAAAAPAASAAPGDTDTGARPTVPSFGARDPDARAQRLARALVSDIVAYHPDRVERALSSGALRSEFRDEIMKSWEEYVAQVGAERAKGTPFFREALNEILAQGQKVF